MAELYCFGRFTLNPDSRKLLADGASTPVGTTAVRLLLALVEQAGQVVSKDDLMSRVWGRTAIADNRLHVHVYELRKTLGDDSIATKSGRGYRFVAPVQRRPAQPSPAKTSTTPTLGTAKTSEPANLIGRDQELDQISRLLGEYRLVTLIGPGGVGKTSLALHLARASQFPDGVWVVELATLSDPTLLAAAVATVLDIKPGQNAQDTIKRQLARKKLLIVLDNCEHVLSAAAAFSEELIRAASDVKILATSREPLSCVGEQIFHVPPLAFPTDAAMPPDAMRATAAIALFIRRVQSADSRILIDDHGVSVAARICRRVGGLPLAIEMVSSWVDVLGLDALETKLDGSLKTWLRARNTAPARHSTLLATMEWSHDLLSPAEQIVLRRLAVFPGGFTLEEAEAAASGDGIKEQTVFQHVGGLLRKSMIAAIHGAQTRRFHLMETTRAFALEKLTASGEEQATRCRHAQQVHRALERANDEWETTSDAVWLDRHRPILDDLRVALEWAMEHSPADAIAIAGASWPIWREFALHVEGRQRLAAAAEHFQTNTPPQLEARLRRGLGELWTNSGAVRRANDEFIQSAELYRALGDLFQLGAALSRLAFTSVMLEKRQDAELSMAEALPLLEKAGKLRALASAYATQVVVEDRLGRYERACAVGEKAIRLCETVGAERLRLVVAGNLAEFALEQDDIDGAVEAGRALISDERHSAHSDVQAFVLGIMVAALTFRGDFVEALATARRAAPLLREQGMLFELLDHLALRAALVGRPRDAARIIGYSDAAYQAANRPREPIGKRAATHVRELLKDNLPENEIATLNSRGATLTEARVTALALSE